MINGINGENKDNKKGPIMASNIHINRPHPPPIGKISILTRNIGDLGMIFDRNMEFNVRLLLCPFALDLETRSIVGENEDEIEDALEIHIFSVLFGLAAYG